MMGYKWKTGDVFTNGTSRWAVDSIDGDKAVMRSCGSSWATTIPLTFDEWREGGRWQLEVTDGNPPATESSPPNRGSAAP
jgi:hypothetical protein